VADPVLVAGIAPRPAVIVYLRTLKTPRRMSLLRSPLWIAENLLSLPVQPPPL
jgi:hypothetical protein